MKSRSMEWKKVAEEATAPNGSSSMNLDKLINEVLLSWKVKTYLSLTHTLNSMCFLCYMSIVNWSGVVNKSLNILYLRYFLILFWVLGLFEAALFCWKEFLNSFSSWLLHHFNIIYVLSIRWDAFDLGCGSFFAVLFLS